MCMAAELLLTDDRTVLHNFKYSQDQILLLRLHHRQLVASNKFTRRVSYRPSIVHPNTIYEPQDFDDGEIDDDNDLRAPKRGITDITSSTLKRDKSKRPRFNITKGRQLFSD